MAYTLAIDPGLSTGWAVFNGGTLIKCGICTPESKPHPQELGTVGAGCGAFTRWVLAIEMPEVVPSTPSIPSILKLCITVGRYVEWFKSNGGKTVDYLKPASWKGQVPKVIHHPRIYAALMPGEQSKVYEKGLTMPEKKREDMMDAIGLGLCAVGRRVR